MTLTLPLLYIQSAPNKNKSPNLWHLTSILVCCIFGTTYQKTTVYCKYFFWISESADREPVECCEDGEFRPLTSKSEFERMICIPIEVPRSDILPTRCINLVRSIAVNNLECSGGPIEQINQISHWFDASNIYGSVPSVQAQVIRFF